MSVARADHVTVISGPSGVGKGTVVARLQAQCPAVWVSVSATTRAPRPGEVDGVAYHFVTPDAFRELIATGGLLEYAFVHRSDYYGTPRQPVLDALAAGREVILEIEPQGARQVRAAWPEARLVFLLPPSWAELEHRLVGRGTEDAATRARRLETARQEIDGAGDFDHLVVNGELGKTVTELVGLLGLSAPGDDARGAHQEP